MLRPAADTDRLFCSAHVSRKLSVLSPTPSNGVNALRAAPQG